MHYGQNKRDAIEEKLLKIIEKLEKEPDEDEIFVKLSNLSEENPRPSKKEYKQVEVAAKQCTTACMAHSPM